MLRSMLTILMLAAVALAGCADETPTQSTPTSTPADETPTQEPVREEKKDGKKEHKDDGGSDPDPSPQEETPDQGNLTPVQPGEPAIEPGTTRSWSVDEAGYLPDAAHAPGVAFLSGAILFGSNRWFRQDVPGTVVGANLTMDWTPQLGTETLTLTFTPIEVDGGAEFYAGDTRQIVGPPPLSLELDDLFWRDGTYTVTAWWDMSGPFVALETTFRISGEILYEP